MQIRKGSDLRNARKTGHFAKLIKRRAFDPGAAGKEMMDERRRIGLRRRGASAPDGIAHDNELWI